MLSATLLTETLSTKIDSNFDANCLEQKLADAPVSNKTVTSSLPIRNLTKIKIGDNFKKKIKPRLFNSNALSEDAPRDSDSSSFP